MLNEWKCENMQALFLFFVKLLQIAKILDWIIVYSVIISSDLLTYIFTAALFCSFVAN